jgi:23S rRNA pseudouridine1911/1915/1917 synthase
MDDAGFSVLYRGETCLVVCKPPGVLTQAPPGVDSLETRIKTWLDRTEPRPYPVYLGVPHRLDRPASGAIVFALNARATRKLSRQFERREVLKRYWAGVTGSVSPPAGQWEDYVRKVPNEPRAEIVAPDHPEGRIARLSYRTLATDGATTWLEIELETGRTHQIRIQASSRGHPLLGDVQYGAATGFGPAFDDVRMQAIALHARRLEFSDPATKKPVAVVAPTAAEWPGLE